MAWTVPELPWQREPSQGSGIYKWVDGQLVKVSDRTTDLDPFDCYVPEGGHAFENLGATPVQVDTRAKLRRELQRRGLRQG